MNICFIGGGNMTTALIGGLLDSDYTTEQLRVVEINPDNRDKLLQKFGLQATADLAEGVAGSDVIVLAVKPMQLREVALQLAPLLGEQLMISIAAGVRALDLTRWLDTQKLVRAMPNTPALVQCGMTGMFAIHTLDHAYCKQASEIMKSVGDVLWVVDELLLDGITAISGGGPAYAYYFIEAMQQAARKLGFSNAEARQLTFKSILGAIKLAEVTETNVSVLRARVTSKNGTTERAIHEMNEKDVRESIINAVIAAALRSKEIGDELGAEQE